MNKDTVGKKQNEGWKSGGHSLSGDRSSPIKLFSESLKRFTNVEPEIIL